MLKTLLKRGLRELGYEVRRPPVGEDAYALQRDILDESSPVIFDVGAHEGTVVRKYLGLFPRATIHAFEPTPAALRGLRAAFGADGRVHIHEVALSETEGTATIHKNLFGDTNSSRATGARKNTGGRVCWRLRTSCRCAPPRSSASPPSVACPEFTSSSWTSKAPSSAS